MDTRRQRVSRKRSCVQCRLHKARCSLGKPCLHCLGRNLDCQYDTGSNRDYASPRNLQPKLSSPWSQNEPDEPRAAPATSGGMSSGDLVDLEQRLPLEADSGQLGWLESPDQENNTPWPLALLSGCLAQPDLQVPFPDNDDMLWNQTFLRDGVASPEKALVPQVQTEVPTPNICNVSLPESWRVYDKSPLKPRKTHSDDACLARQVLLGQIFSYPAMLTSGSRLPPFIFSPCSVDGIEAWSMCSSKGYHQCLPQPLAICCALIRSWQMRTAGNESWIWDSIEAEVSRLRREHHKFSQQELLAAIQAATLYLILQASDPNSVGDHNIELLATTPTTLIAPLNMGMDWKSSRTSLSPIDRQGWLLREGLRRSVCLSYGLELLLDVILSPLDHDVCGGYTQVPVPCTRDLWEPLSNSAWAARVKGRKDEVLTIHDLQHVKRRGNADEAGRAMSIEKLTDAASWCRGADDFGVLVWTACMMGGDVRERE
ncbi:hypothetical protein B0I35DRAFT_435433 [Stachybotrys elegans]|uniref:Zn(2)-C6 fungal-type domain-containing protein n=1 Tax=Stachybotrys elegans TaxID=80388 RepID=A0A8K0SIW3_9HYPO|nr:hypothetical protein B0I35DRAFT_435433 [Stachybotrys elegans]